MCALLFVAVNHGTAARAGESTEEKTEEARVWEAEEQLLAKAALEKDGFNPLQRSYVGLVQVEKVGFSEDEKANVQTINVGRFLTKGRMFVLRLENPDLLAVLRKAPSRKPVNLVGTVRVNGKYFVVRDVSMVVTGQGSAAPRARRRPGGL
jgi:hypothetical protein